MKRTNDVRYKFLQGFYWMAFCVAAGYRTLYMQSRGLDTATIGMLSAAFGVAAALAQPLLGSLCDRSARLDWRKMLLTLSALFLAVSALTPVLPGAWAGGVMIGLLFLLANLMMPFVNAANFYYLQRGENINFGVARGIGSGLYALLALVMGELVDRLGIHVVPAAGVLIGGGLLLTALRMPCAAQNAPLNAVPRQRGRTGFLRRYPRFALMLLASLMMLTSHNIITTYLPQIIQSLGGGSGEFGIALAIPAAVEVPVLFCFAGLRKRFRSAALMLIAAAGFALKAVLFVLSRTVVMVYLTQLTQMLGFAVFASASVYYAAESVRQEDQATGQALMSSMTAAATVAGSLAGGWVLQLCGVSMLLLLNAGVSLLGVGVAWLSFRQEPKGAEA